MILHPILTLKQDSLENMFCGIEEFENAPKRPQVKKNAFFSWKRHVFTPNRDSHVSCSVSINNLFCVSLVAKVCNVSVRVALGVGYLHTTGISSFFKLDQGICSLVGTPGDAHV